MSSSPPDIYVRVLSLDFFKGLGAFVAYLVISKVKLSDVRLRQGKS